LLGAGLEFLAAVVACTAIGYGADWLLGLPAVGTILGAFAGFAAGLYRLVKTTAPRP
jgi:F0F1-type ATP synthase assembly protein I